MPINALPVKKSLRQVSEDSKIKSAYRRGRHDAQKDIAAMLRLKAKDWDGIVQAAHGALLSAADTVEGFTYGSGRRQERNEMLEMLARKADALDKTGEAHAAIMDAIRSLKEKS